MAFYLLRRSISNGAIMGNVFTDSLETYFQNLKLVLLFSIPFIIAVAIPLFAPLPTYITAGGIFLRSASIFINTSPVSISVIIFSMFFSLLFLSFAFVAISLIVKSRRTHTKIAGSVLKDIEKYISRVFVVLLVYALVVIATNILASYYLPSLGGVLTSLVGFIAFLIIFYAPSAIVVDNKRILTSIKDSTKLMYREPLCFLGWLLLSTISISILDVVAIGITGTLLSRYVVLIITSLLILPYFVILQAEAYMKRFPLLRH